jgi:hypothetical protein
MVPHSCEDFKMRFSVTVALLTLFVLVGTGTGQEKAQEKKVADDWFKSLYEPGLFLKYAGGKVLDVFDANQLLLSLGADQGAQKGWKMEVYRLKPEPLYVGTVELTEVGAKHSIGRFRGREQVRENDLVSWRSPVSQKVQQQPRVSETWELRGGHGGAIIDLTRP